MKIKVAVVDDQMDSDIASEASQENEVTPPPHPGDMFDTEDSEDDSEGTAESEDETVKAGNKIKDVMDKEANNILKRKKNQQAEEVKKKKAKVENDDDEYVEDDQMDGDAASDKSQEVEETPPKDIIESRKLELSSDLEKSLNLTNLKGMVGADFTLRFYHTSSIRDSMEHPDINLVDIRCHRFMLAARSEVFHFLMVPFPYGNPQASEWKICLDGLCEVSAKNTIKYIYTGTIDDVPIDTFSAHLKLVFEFKLYGLAELVQRRIIDSLDASNCIKYLNMALSNLFPANDVAVVAFVINGKTFPFSSFLLQLKEKAIRTIVDNLSTLVSLHEWKDLLRSQPSLTAEILIKYFKPKN